MSELSSERGRVIVASEGTYGTNAVDTIFGDDTLDIIYQDVRNCVITPVREIIEIARHKAAHDGTAHCTIPDSVTVEMEVPLTARVGTGAGEEAPYYDAILKAMNLEPTLVSTTSATYAPVTKQQAAMTVHHYQRNLEDDNWRQHVALGVRGSGSFFFNLNEEAYFTFSGSGLYFDELSTPAEYFDPSTFEAALESDGSTAVTARDTGTEVVADASPMCVNSMTLTVDSTTYEVAALQLDLNWTVAIQRAITGDGNAQKVLLTRPMSGARIGGSLDLQAGDAPLTELLADYKSGAEIALAISIDDGTDRIRINASNLQIGAPSPGDNSGIRTYAVPFFLNGSGGLTEDDSFELIYDAAP